MSGPSHRSACRAPAPHPARRTVLLLDLPAPPLGALRRLLALPSRAELIVRNDRYRSYNVELLADACAGEADGPKRKGGEACGWQAVAQLVHPATPEDAARHLHGGGGAAAAASSRRTLRETGALHRAPGGLRERLLAERASGSCVWVRAIVQGRAETERVLAWHRPDGAPCDAFVLLPNYTWDGVRAVALVLALP